MPIPPAFEPARPLRPSRRRLWSARHASGLARIYRVFESLLLLVAPFARRIGMAKLERPVAGVEAAVKRSLFDCRMCGSCMLSSSGLSCPMNCPKALRNGPCGGVRANGNCEVVPEMVCVWVAAWQGAQKIEGGIAAIQQVQPLLDHRTSGRSSWLALIEKSARP